MPRFRHSIHIRSLQVVIVHVHDERFKPVVWLATWRTAALPRITGQSEVEVVVIEGAGTQKAMPPLPRL
eukprot:4860484-Pyramimonas_sp.AAC.1